MPENVANVWSTSIFPGFLSHFFSTCPALPYATFFLGIFWRHSACMKERLWATFLPFSPLLSFILVVIAAEGGEKGACPPRKTAPLHNHPLFPTSPLPVVFLEFSPQLSLHWTWKNMFLLWVFGGKMRIFTNIFPFKPRWFPRRISPHFAAEKKKKEEEEERQKLP